MNFRIGRHFDVILFMYREEEILRLIEVEVHGAGL